LNGDFNFSWNYLVTRFLYSIFATPKLKKKLNTIGYEDKAFIDLDGNHDDGGWMVTGKQEDGGGEHHIWTCAGHCAGGYERFPRHPLRKGGALHASTAREGVEGREGVRPLGSSGDAADEPSDVGG
jgi:hypothetical protein